MQSLNVIPYEIKIQKQITYSQHTMAQDIHYHSKMEEGEDSEEMLDQSKTENRLGKLCISMSDVKMLLRSPTPVSFVDCTHLSLWAGSTPWQ